MTTVVDLHSSAMALVDRAEEARAGGDLKRATLIYRRALKRELEAIALLRIKHPNVEPSWSVMHASAAAIAIKASEFRKAEQLIGVGLAGDATDDILDELRELLDEAQYRRHLDLKGVQLVGAQFQFTLAGPAVASGMASPEVTQRRTESMRRMLERTAERQAHVPFRNDGMVSAVVRNTLAIQYSEPRAASFALTVSVEQRSRQLSLNMEGTGPAAPKPDEVVSEFLDCVRLVEEGRLDALRERIGNDDYFTNFVGLARGMAPDGRDITLVGFTRGDGRKAASRLAMRKTPRMIEPPLRPKRAGESLLSGKLDGFDGQVSQRGPLAQVLVVDDEGVKRTVHVPKAILADVVRPRFLEQVTMRVARRGKGLLFVEFVESSPT